MDVVVYILAALGALILLLLAIILIRTLSFKPKPEITPDTETIEFDKEASVEGLKKLIMCRTVSNYDHALEDEEEFCKLIDLLPELYPNVFSTCTLTKLPDRALLFRWKGKTDGAPTVLMAHYDVVPVKEEDWDMPPFGATVENNVIYGRGSLDTKATFHSSLFAVNKLIGEGFAPECDVYLAYSGGEEVNGPGASHIVEFFKENGISPAMVLDEGGAVVENVFPGVKRPCALIGIAEKGILDLKYTTKSNGGHASAPKPHTPVGILARACTRVEKKPFKRHLTAPVSKMFDTLGRHSTFVYRMIFANMWLFEGLLDKICIKSGGELNALLRTTVAFTQMQGGATSNVIPPEATMVSNIRLNPCDTIESAIEYIGGVIGDEDVKLSVVRGMDPSPISDADNEAYQKIERAIASTWHGSIVSPYLMVQCSDSRHWSRISDRVYRFSALDLTSEERATIHAKNEGIRIEALHRCCEFYLRLIKNC